MQDILFIDKPKGITSFDVIRRLRKKLGVKKMGHAGTLDPNATGLLIIGLGKGTGHLSRYLGLPKTYVMEILLGIRTDTGDVDGKIIEEVAVFPRPTPSVGHIRQVLAGMIGSVALPIPPYSALKYKGKPRYVYARKGIAIEPKTRGMEIYVLRLLGIRKEGERPLLKVEMRCGSGTYARSVAEEIGRRLGFPATLKELRRTRIGEFNVDRAEKIE